MGTVCCCCCQFDFGEIKFELCKSVLEQYAVKSLLMFLTVYQTDSV